MGSSNIALPQPGPGRVLNRKRLLLLGVLAILTVVLPFTVWHETWFGRPLSPSDITSYLQDDQHPRKIQHALSQISDHIIAHDGTVSVWYPQVASLAHHSNVLIRMTAAWVMGQDAGSKVFHQTLLELLRDPEVMVRRNAALSLVRFGDSNGRRELVGMLRVYQALATVQGKISIHVLAGQTVGAGAKLAVITAGDNKQYELAAPFAGQVVSIDAQDHSMTAAGDRVVTLKPGAEQVWEALRGLYLVGEAQDLPEVEHYGRAYSDMSREINRQAILTSQAIRNRSALESTH